MTTFEDIEIDLPYPAYAKEGLKAVVDLAEEYMQRSIVLFASGFDGGQPDMIAWLAENELLSKEGRKLTEDGAQKLQPKASVMTDGYGENSGKIQERAEQLRTYNGSVNQSAIASFDTSNKAFQDVIGIVDELKAELSGEHQVTRWPDGNLYLTVAEEVRLLRLIAEAVDAVHDRIEDADRGMQRDAKNIYDLMPDLPRNPYGSAPDVGSQGPWAQAPSTAKIAPGNGSRDDIVAKAQEQLRLGVTESGGNNIPVFRGPDGKLYKAPYNINDAWCAAFSTWVWDQSGYNVDWSNKNYVPAIWNDAKHLGLAAHISSAQRGDMIIFDWEGDGTPDHVGIVESVDPRTGRINTIEGNSSDRLQNQSYSMNSGSLVGVVRPPSSAADRAS
ncbi:CHAP domain-containing protein [Nocardia sp. NBC_00508]|uniref:C40 family peptidase n=1 Tax=Nocardia sp. NBC_00508 TaxID=2975992 RepID=UPI002E822988|nr:CHAP domain-containing protein [Nocardia sp. NBC_00508]WUD65052.1 CHAP domain-containing protein [Nocardia sp. NBC_00508]